MRVTSLAVRNIARNKARTVLTITGVAIAVLAFVLLRTVITAWTAAADHAAKDRIGTRHKVSFISPIPRRYVEEIESMPGVKRSALAQWFGAKYPKAEREFFASIAVEPKSFLDVYDEIVLPAEQKENWFQNRRGAIVGSTLAKHFGWKVGEKITLSGTIFPGDWEFEISGIHTATRRSIDQSSFWFHYDYLNDALPPRRRDQVGWVVSRIDDPGRVAEISKHIDEKFEERDVQTLSMSERALNTSFLGMISAVLAAIDVVSVVILVIMGLVLGNTIAMGVRERTHEYGVLKAIGFQPGQVATFIVLESIVIAAAGGLLGIGLSYPLVEQGLGRFLEENMGGFFPYVRIATTTTLAALGLALVLGLVAALIPARQASGLNPVDALRRIG